MNSHPSAPSSHTDAHHLPCDLRIYQRALSRIDADISHRLDQCQSLYPANTRSIPADAQPSPARNYAPKSPRVADQFKNAFDSDGHKAARHCNEHRGNHVRKWREDPHGRMRRHESGGENVERMMWHDGGCLPPVADMGRSAGDRGEGRGYKRECLECAIERELRRGLSPREVLEEFEMQDWYIYAETLGDVMRDCVAGISEWIERKRYEAREIREYYRRRKERKKRMCKGCGCVCSNIA